MGRSVKSLDPKVRERVEQLLAEGKLSDNKNAKKCRIDFRLVSDVKKLWKEAQEDKQADETVAETPEEADVLDRVKDPDKKQEIIEQYRQELVPLIVPITLVNHYVRKYDQPYLREQYYLHPHPIEMRLRNHV